MVAHEAIFQGSPTPWVHPPELDVVWILPKGSGPQRADRGVRCGFLEDPAPLRLQRTLWLPQSSSQKTPRSPRCGRRFLFKNSPASLSPACSVAELVPGVWKS